MDFFSKAKETITKTSGDVAKKAKDLSGIAKMSSQIAANESTIKVTYEEIGQYVYENLREDAPSDMVEKMAVIDAAKAEIERLQAEILKIKGNIKCEGCGKEVDITFAFCPNCGHKMPEPVVDIIDEEEVKEVVEEAAETVEEAVETTEETVE